jgi:hypothetical protein
VSLVLLENHLVTQVKIKKLRDNYLLIIGQSSLPILNRVGTHMYWNNSWVNFFNKKNFFNKILFFENIFYFLFSDKLFRFFFKGFTNSFYKSFLFKKLYIKKKNKVRNVLSFRKNKKKKIIKTKKLKYNFTRLWFVKYNNYILLTTFIFFYFKIKKKKIKKKNFTFFSKTFNIFLKKKRGFNFKKKLFLPQVTKFF